MILKDNLVLTGAGSGLGGRFNQRGEGLQREAFVDHRSIPERDIKSLFDVDFNVNFWLFSVQQMILSR